MPSEKTKHVDNGRRNFLKSTAASAGAAFLAAPGVSMLSAPAYAQGGKHLNMMIGSEPPNLDPQALEQRTPRQVTWNIYEQLVDRDPDGNIVPSLATSWERLDPLTVRFKLREDVKFHNGQPFNADSAVFSVNRILDPNTASQWIGVVNTIEGATKVDDYTIDIKTKDLDPIFMGRVYAIAMMEPSWVEEMGGAVGNSAMGTGPYRLKEWKRNVVVQLEAFDGYWGRRPEVQSVSFFIIGEDATRFQMIKTEEMDGYLGPLPDHLPELKNFRSGLAQLFSFLRFSNVEGSKILDPRVRQAMNYSVNKQIMLDRLHHGQGEVLPGQISSRQMFGFNPNLQPYEYDLDRAKTLIAEAGAQGAEVDFVGPKGRYSGDAIEMQAIAGMVEDCGLKVNLKLRDPQSWVRIGDRNQTPQPPSCWYVRHSNFLFDADRTFSTYYTSDSPFSSYHNDEIRTRYDAAKKEMDVETRRKLYNEAFAIGRDQDPCALFLLQHTDLWALSTKANFEPRPDGNLQISDFTLEG